MKMVILPRDLIEKETLLGLGRSFYAEARPGFFKGWRGWGGVTLCQSESTHKNVMFLAPAVGYKGDGGHMHFRASLATSLLRSVIINLRDSEKWEWGTGKFGRQITRIWSS